jgi:hypothetical protein
MNRFDQQWQKLTALARSAPAEPAAAAPHGFATRVAARAATAPLAPWAGFERVALRGLLVAAALGVAAIALNYSVIQSEPAEDFAATDAIPELLGII